MRDVSCEYVRSLVIGEQDVFNGGSLVVMP